MSLNPSQRNVWKILVGKKNKSRSKENLKVLYEKHIYAVVKKKKTEKKETQTSLKMGANTSCIDCCFGPAKDESLFDNSNTRNRNIPKLSAQDIRILINNNALGILVLTVLEAIFLAFWVSLSYVDGFALYDGVGGHPNPLSHLGFWFIIELLVVLSGLGATFFRLGSNERKNSLELQVRSTQTYLIYYIGVLAAGIIANFIHAALSIVEAGYCSSSFCRGYNVINPANASLLANPNPAVSGFLIAFIVLLFVDAFLLQMVLIYRSVVFRTHLNYAVWGATRIFDVEMGNGSGGDGDDASLSPQDDNVSPSPSQTDVYDEYEKGDDDVESEESASSSSVSNQVVGTIMTPAIRAARQLRARQKKE